ncbi:LacI family DNA-binding transcriptional regulator [Natronosporangium hydrolyticum]|uniref:LacI family DNA-binding transcriptional regulator n=1 Tax=Natronosporangium hydrolyticum TaxID=2811111 RepID=A0A895YDA3_9ACTN|nr:LacI family DNA-binding transcriptional regulator [Natronosporangium hydrolyticum]QSB15784.1 LacI family DNA-binding transcriptional regulator [Natronosporangium hydrolyticum]
MATLVEVARRAGVSPATASRILSGSSKPVSEELRRRVLAAAETLQYVPNAHAQQLARSQPTAVGVIVHDVSDPYFAEITRGLQRVATDAGRLVFICNSYRDPRREREYVGLLHGHRTAAIVLAGSGHHDRRAAAAIAAALRRYARDGGRVAVVGRHLHHPGDEVLPDNEAGGRLAGAELYRLGHHRIGVIAGPRDLTTTSDRLAGLRAAARAHNRSLPARRIAYADFDRESGAAAAAALLDAEPGLTALAVLNDTMAIGALAVARERALRVPGQLSVVGFDDMPIARDLVPALTTVRLPLAEIGAEAMRLALATSGEPRSVAIEPELVRRASTATAPE